MSLNEKKLENFLQLADEICSLAEEMGAKFLNTYEAQLKWRERINFAFFKKMFLTFKALINDSSNRRAEAVHHLKTLVESFIYVYWINRQESCPDKNAKLVTAKFCNEKKKFFEKNGKDFDESFFEEWTNHRNEIIKDLDDDWAKFKNRRFEDIAKECTLDGIYNRIYKLACEPAHIADLVEYMPSREVKFSLAEKPKTSESWAFVALDYGCFIMSELLKGTTDVYHDLHFDSKIAHLKNKYETIRNL